MRSLIQFFIRFHAFFFFLALEVLCVVLIVQNNSYHRSNIINSTNFVTGNVLASLNNVSTYFSLNKQNKQLAEEIARLKTERSISAKHPAQSRSDEDFSFLAAKVINNTTRNSNNYITLNKGSDHGIDIRMGVICQDGVVGIVKDVSGGFSSVLSLLHRNARISARHKKSGTIGSANWDGRSPYEVRLTEIPQYVKLAIGDTVVTSGFSAVFPANIPVGTISNFEKLEGSDFYAIDIRLTASFDNLSYVLVVNNQKAAEKRTLEEESQQHE
jgi:rod shape-determining protein MreC